MFVQRNLLSVVSVAAQDALILGYPTVREDAAVRYAPGDTDALRFLV